MTRQPGPILLTLGLQSEQEDKGAGEEEAEASGRKRKDGRAEEKEDVAREVK